MKQKLTLPADILAGRRQFLKYMAGGIGSAAIAFPSLANLLHSPFEAAPSGAVEEALQTGRKLGVALVGLGKYSTEQLGPALRETKLCSLKGIVTGTTAKVATWQGKYGIPTNNIYNYQTFSRIADNPDIDIVYIVLPNPMHAEYTIRALDAGKHVICEKPMAMSVKECQQMIDAAKKAGKMLSVGYRLHFDPYHQEMMRLGQKEVFGKVNRIIAGNAQKQSNDTPWRLGNGIGGGGPVRDVGIYCLQGAIYTKGDVPVSVTAKFHPITDKEKFKKVEEGVDFQLQFADGSVADCRTSYNDKYNQLRAEAAKGWFELEPAYEYKGLKGKTQQTSLSFPPINQQALQMDAFAGNIINNQPTRVPGEMGMRDVAIIESIFQAAETGRKVNLNLEASARNR